MSLTVGQLTELPQLATRFLAGASGGTRPVVWAHTCELPEPWQWLGTGDLLMSDGYGFPATAEDQTNFISQLAAANLSGLALAEGMHAPAVTTQALAVADELGFPLLSTAYSVPFVTMARTVAESNMQDSSKRLHKILRVYDIHRRATNDPARAGLLTRLGDEINTDLAVADIGQGFFVLGPTAVPDELIALVGVKLGERDGPLPAFTRVTHGKTTVMVLPLDERSEAVLVALARDESTTPDLVVLQHVVTIVATEVERRAGLALRRRVNATRTFRQILEGSLNGAEAAGRLRGYGLGEGPWLVSALSTGPGEVDLERTHLRLIQAGRPNLLLPTDPGLLVLTDTLTDDELAALAECVPLVSPALASDPASATRGIPAEQQLPPSAADRKGQVSRRSAAQAHQPTIGVSREVQSPDRLPDAAREARWAVEAALANRESLVRYGDQVPMFMPSTLAEGEAIVARVLGELITYDASNKANLLVTLGTYFDTNRAVQTCAQRLGVHKQTVVYRMRRIEEVTGRDLQDIGDLTSLFLAYRTWLLLSADGFTVTGQS